ncbi:MAG: hypothetical protein HY898_09725 [Deltaproteobacteria bacterium]|nr:hypothetical protein [Deltaproteobacteria bacterium]
MLPRFVFRLEGRGDPAIMRACHLDLRDAPVVEPQQIIDTNLALVGAPGLFGADFADLLGMLLAAPLPSLALRCRSGGLSRAVAQVSCAIVELLLAVMEHGLEGIRLAGRHGSEEYN